MARTIESPGIEIREIDLSNISTLPIGTNILLQGFAAQGPTSELLNITSKTELEQVYGEPTTPAERYFIQSAKEVLNSPGRLLVNRLPYGNGSGAGTSPTRSALLYPYVPVFQTNAPETTSATLQTDGFSVAAGQISFTLSQSYSAGISVTVSESVSAQGTDLSSVTGQFLAYSTNVQDITITDPAGNTYNQFLTSVENYGTYSQFNFKGDFDVDIQNIIVRYQISGSEYVEPTFNTTSLTLTDLVSSSLLGLSATYYWPEVSSQGGVTYGSNISMSPASSAVQTYLKGFVLGAPALLPNLTEAEVEQLLDGAHYAADNKEYVTADSANIAGANLADDSTSTSSLFALGKKAGMIVLNSNFANTESDYTGYYIGVNDNNNISDDTYDKFKYAYTRTGNGTYKRLSEISNVTLKTNLTGTITENAGSISEVVEIGPAFSTAYAAASGTQYQHALEFSLWKFYEDTSETQGNSKVLRSYYNVAPFVGSFVKNFKDSLNNPYGGQSEQSIFVEDVYSSAGARPWLDIRVNPVIKDNMTESRFVRMWKDIATFETDPVVTTTLDSTSITDVSAELTTVFGGSTVKPVDGLFSIGPYAPTTQDSGKQIGDVALKLDRGLALAENIDLIPLELVLDGGLSTVNAVMKNDAESAVRGIYNDAINFNAVDGAGHQDWLVIFNSLNNFCQQTRQDCMCIVDPLRHIFVQNENTKVIDQKSKTFSQHILTPLRNLVNSCNSSYAAIYGNWVRAYDTGTGSFFWAPFSGYEASIMARMDALLQPWFAPAGLNNGIIRNITDIAIKPTQRERDLLYRFGINPITSFPRDGFVVYGQKTLQAKPSAFDRINVRRLFLFLEKATRQIAKYFVFEPNTVFTRTRFVNVLTPIFELAKRNQGVYDYLIVCDERNNTPDVIDRNELVVDIYIKPVRTAEFILINFIATRTGANFEEIISGTGA